MWPWLRLRFCVLPTTWSLLPIFTGCLEEHHGGDSDLLYCDDALPSRSWDPCASLGTLHALLQSQLSVDCLEALLGNATVSEVSSMHI